MRADVNAKLTMGGRFKIYATGQNGETRVLADWFENLITNNGLDLCASQNSVNWYDVDGMLGSVHVGAGSTPPQISDSQLEFHIASTSNKDSYTTGINSAERYFRNTITWTFQQGAAAGNISEIGVGPSHDNLFSRALVRDGFGNPTTITVTSEDFLTVVYELRINQPTADFTSTVDGYSIVLRSARVDSTTFQRWDAKRFELNTGFCTACEGVIQAIDSNPSDLHFATSASSAPYSLGTFTRSGTFVFDTSAANVEINSFYYEFHPGVFQFSVNPPIQKNNTMELTVTVSLTWGREGEG